MKDTRTWLLGFLNNRGGEALVSEVVTAAEVAGYSRNTLKVAIKRMRTSGKAIGVGSEKRGSDWWWVVGPLAEANNPPEVLAIVGRGKAKKGSRALTVAEVNDEVCDLENFSNLAHEKRALFLAELSRGATINEACKVSGLSYSAVQRERLTDDEFARESALAYSQGTDVHEAAARKRAIDGVEVPVLYQGEQVILKDEEGVSYLLTERKYSDALLKLLLGARDPARFRDSRVELTGAGGGPIENRVVVEFVE